MYSPMWNIFMLYIPIRCTLLQYSYTGRLLKSMDLFVFWFSFFLLSLLFLKFFFSHLLSSLFLMLQLISQSPMKFGSQGNAMLANVQCRRRNAKVTKNKETNEKRVAYDAKASIKDIRNKKKQPSPLMRRQYQKSHTPSDRINGSP